MSNIRITHKNVTEYNYSKKEIAIATIQVLTLNDWHAKLLKNLLVNGYVELRGDYLNDIGQVKEEISNAYYDLLELGIIEEDEMAWHQTGNLISRETAQEMYNKYFAK